MLRQSLFGLLALLCLTGPARSDVYLAFGGLISDTSTNKNQGQLLDADSDYNTGFGGSGAVGVRLLDDFRIEGELGYRRAEFATFTIINDGGLAGGALNGQTVPADGDVRTFTTMVNAYYDLPVDWQVRPYVGFSVGASHVKSEAILLGATVVDDASWAFTWRGTVGASYELTERLDLFAGYRYFSVVGLQLEDVGGNEFDAEYDSHDFEFGLRYRF